MPNPVYITQADIYSTTDSLSVSLIYNRLIVEPIPSDPGLLFIGDVLGTYVNSAHAIVEAFTTSDALVNGSSYTSLLTSVFTTSDSTISNSLLTRGLTAVFTTGNVINPQFPVSAFFKPYESTPVTATFRQSSEEDTVIQAKFIQSVNIPVSAVYRAGNLIDITVQANLGSISKAFNVSGIYRQKVSTDFPAQMTIQINTVAKPPAYSGKHDTPATIRIVRLGKKDTTVTAKYRVPPIDQDYVVTARFGGNIIVIVTNVVTNQRYTSRVDADGFWFVNDLPPGQYSVAPYLSSKTFDPPVTQVNLTKCSPTLYFTEVGVFDINNPFE